MGDSPAVILRGPEELIKEQPIDRLIVDRSKKEMPDKANLLWITALSQFWLLAPFHHLHT